MGEVPPTVLQTDGRGRVSGCDRIHSGISLHLHLQRTTGSMVTFVPASRWDFLGQHAIPTGPSEARHFPLPKAVLAPPAS